MLLQKGNEMFLSFALVFVCCEFGHKMSTAFEQIDHVIGKSHWYRFPLHVWKMLPMLVAGAQESAGLRVFGSVSLTREDFKNVRTLQRSKLCSAYLVWVIKLLNFVSGYQWRVLLFYGAQTI